jgi:transcriptional regulator with GAF, ATPase, and Fis domain
MQSYVLTPYQQEILEWLAVYGGPMPEGILFTILPCQRIADLVTLQRKGWLQRIESKGWAFKHSTKRGQIYENIPEETRAIMHREIAQLLEERADKDEEGQIIEEIASHYIRTQPCDRGKEVVSRAAQKAFREGFYPFALNLYQKLLTWLEDQDPMFIDTLLRTAASAKEAGQFSEATKHYKRLEVLCDRLEAPQKVEYLLGVMDMYGKQNQWDRVKPLAEEILGLYQRGLCTPVQALEAAEHMVSYGNFTGVSKDVINLWCNRALDLAKQASDPVRTAGWLLHTLDSRTDLKDIESARVIRQVTHATEEGLKIVDKSNDLHMRSLFYTDAAVGLMAMIGDFTRARECAQKALELAESIWSYSGSSFALTTLARIEMMMGELSASEERLKASLRAAERSREAWRLIYAKLHWMQLLLFQDRYKELLSYDYTPLNLDQPRHLGDYAAKLRRARVYLYLGDYKKAMDETSECRRLLEERIVIGGASIFWETLIEIYQEIGQLDDAEKLCHQAIQYFQATCFRRQVGDFMLLLAKTKFLQGRIEEGLDIIQRPPPAGRDIHRILSAHLLECRLWLSKGVRSKAREALTEAKEATERLSRRSAIAEVCWLEGELALQDPDADLWGIARKIQEALNLVDQIGLPGLKWRLLATQGRIYLKMRDLERAFESLRGAIQILARLRHRLPGKEYRQSYISSNRGDIVIKDLKEIRKELISMKQALGDDFSVLAILELVKRLNAQVNLDKLLSEIMDTALNISGAERGLLILVEDGEFRFPVTRSTNGGDLTGDQLAVSTSIAHRVIQSGQAILTIDALQEHQWQSFQSVQELGIRSVLCLPFKIRDQVIGVLYLDHRLKEGVFSERTKKMLEILCDQMAIAIEQARLRRQEEITWTLIKHMLAPEREAEEGLEALLDGIIKFTHAQRGMVLVFDPEGRPFVVAQRQTTHGDPQQISTRIINKAITTGKVLVMQDVLGDPEIGGYESVREIGIRSLICVPILLAKGFTGAIYLDDLRELKRFSSSTTWLIQLAKELIDPLNLLVETRLRGLELKQTRQDVNALIKQLRQNYDFGNIVARSPSMTQILRQTIQVAKTNVPVLLQGETGVGKELIARAIHYNSPRVTHPFVTIHCSALPPSLLESELFGHEKGAFTGAIQMRKGRLEVAENGTVFLDEISELSLELQAKLLRVLQFGELQRVGSDQTHRIDVRFVTASNKPLEDLVQQGRFREDLLYRLNVVTLTLPPLRERREDIPLLIEHFLQKFSEDLGRKLELQGAAREWLLHYDYPGNVRELENLILRGAILSEYGKIGIEHLVFRRIPEPIYHERLTYRMKLDPMEIRRILKKTHGNVTQSARDLGLTRQHLYRLLLKYNIKVQDYRV